MLSGILLFATSVAIVSAVGVTLLAVPYAFAVARRPARRFWGERAPVGRTLLYVALAFVPLGVAFGLMPRHTYTTVTSVTPGFAEPAPSSPSR